MAGVPLAERNWSFSDWTRESTFHLSLCGWAITELLILHDYHRVELAGGTKRVGVIYSRGTANYLAKRGLIERCKLEGYGNQWVLSDAGRHVCELLLLAGFKA